jgi:hypothetical protein
MYAPNLIRSSVVPQTIASETAQNTNWKNSSAAGLIEAISSNGICDTASVGSPLTLRKNPFVPAISPEPPNASANPTAQ